MRFVILGDLHYSDYSDPQQCEARDRLFTAFLQQVISCEPALVIAIGDTTNRGSLSELKGLEKLAANLGSKLNFIRIMGNHDCYSLPKPEIAPFFLGGLPPVSTEQIYTSFDKENIRFILLDTARDRDFNRYDGLVSEAQLEWLTKNIEDFNANPDLNLLMVFGHHPFYNTTRRSADNMLSIANSEAVHRVLSRVKSKPSFYFCGHNHCHSIAGPDAANWYHIQTADPLDCQSFRLITITAENITSEIIDFDLADPELQRDFENTRSQIEAGFQPQDYRWSYGQPNEHYLQVALTVNRPVDPNVLTEVKSH